MNRNDQYLKRQNPALTITILLVFFAVSTVSAQETKVVKDFELWSGLSVEKKINRHWQINLKEEIRLREDASKINNILSQIGIDYKINNTFTLEGRYRYIRSQNNKLKFENHSRYSLGIVYNKNIWDLSIKYRLRYQKKAQSMNVFDLNVLSEKRIRNKIQFSYDAPKRLEPYISAEIFLLQEVFEFPKYDIIRYQAGLKYNPRKIGEFKLSYAIEKEINTAFPYTHYILGLNYSYSF